jgi:hypothetical protein
MKLNQFLEQLNKLAKEKPEALEMNVKIYEYCAGNPKDIDEHIEICYDDELGNFVGLDSK